MNSLFLDKVPNNWNARAYPSLLPLAAWFADLQIRIKELEGWVTDFTLPNVVWLAGFFNPQSFLTGLLRFVCMDLLPKALFVLNRYLILSHSICTTDHLETIQHY